MPTLLRMFRLASSLFLALLISSSTQVDLCVVQDSDTGCNEALAEYCCYGAGEGVCCYFGDTTERLTAGILPEHVKAQIYEIGSSICTAYLGGCDTGGDPGLHCCLTGGNSQLINSANWFSDGSSKRSTGVTYPNLVKYTDDLGVKRNVSIPQGMHETARIAFVNKKLRCLRQLERFCPLATNVGAMIKDPQFRTRLTRAPDDHPSIQD